MRNLANEITELRDRVQILAYLPNLTTAQVQELEDKSRQLDDAKKIRDGVKAQLGYDPYALSQDPPKFGTLELLHSVAKHLTGMDADIKIERTRGGGSGEMWIAGGKMNILINPDATPNGERYLEVFLHEVAHGKKHKMFFDGTATKADNEKRGNGVIEVEAWAQTNEWVNYANANKQKYYPGAAHNEATAEMQSKLIALLELP